MDSTESIHEKKEKSKKQSKKLHKIIVLIKMDPVKRTR